MPNKKSMLTHLQTLRTQPNRLTLPILSAVVISLALTLFASVGVFAAGDVPHAIYLPLVSTPNEHNGPIDDDPVDDPVHDPIYVPVKDQPSEALIREAVAGGELDDETALLYRVYASFEDTRLPADYRGDDSAAPASVALHEAQARLGTLSAATQAALAPFLLPPVAENSWHEERQVSPQDNPQVNLSSAPNASNAKVKWLTTCNSDPNIKVWYQERYPEDAATARQICEEVAGVIWPRLTSLMGRKPMDDGAESNNGGDGQLDFYLVNARTNNITYRGCDNSPSYITVHRTRWSKALLTSAVMGALLDSYDSADCVEYMWLYAATRTWSIDYVYPQDQWEHHFADDFLLHTDMSLDSFPIMPLEAQNNIGDGAYLWVWFATNILKSAKETVPLWWQNASNPDSLAAVNEVMGDQGFEKEWKNFSGLNWNNEPVDIYKELDGMPHSTKLYLDEVVTLDGTQDRTYEFEADVMPLAAHTFRFKFNDPDLRSVYFYNPFSADAETTADVNAYYRLEDGSWHIEEWTTKHGKSFCRDLKAERVEELVIVISNHEWQNPGKKLEAAKPPRVNVTNVACRGWEYEGTATWIGTGDEYSINDSATVKATFMHQDFGDESDAGSLTYFQATEGSGTWSHVGQHVNCAGNGGGTFEVSGGINTGFFVLSKATDHATSTEYVAGDRRYNGFGGEGTQAEKLTATWVCTSGNTHEQISMSATRWFLTEPVFETNEMVSADGKTIEGSFTFVQDDDFTTDTYTWTWKFTALPPE